MPDADDAYSYWQDIDEPDFPVTGSVDDDIRQVLGYTRPGAATAGNVVLAPDMTILALVEGHGGDDWAYELILEHMAEND